MKTEQRLRAIRLSNLIEKNPKLASELCITIKQSLRMQNDIHRNAETILEETLPSEEPT